MTAEGELEGERDTTAAPAVARGRPDTAAPGPAGPGPVAPGLVGPGLVGADEAGPGPVGQDTTAPGPVGLPPPRPAVSGAPRPGRHPAGRGAQQGRGPGRALSPAPRRGPGPPLAPAPDRGPAPAPDRGPAQAPGRGQDQVPVQGPVGRAWRARQARQARWVWRARQARQARWVWRARQARWVWRVWWWVGRVGRAARRPFRDGADPRRVVRRWPDLTGLCVATVFFWLSLTPSLVPRPWILQGVIGGITAAVGYAVGATLSGCARVAVRASARATVRSLAARRPVRWPRRTRECPASWPRPAVRDVVRVRGWQAYWLLSPVSSAWLLSESADMQRRLRGLQGLPPGLTWHTLMIALIAVVLCALLVLAGRSVRLGARRLIRVLDTWLPRPVAVVAGLLLTGMVVTVGLRDVVFDRGVVDVADRIAETTNRGTKDGVERPTSPYVSGGPGSLVPWEQLGYQGRNFTGTVPTRRDIAGFTGRPAADPIRVYVSSEVPRAFAVPDDENEPFRAQARLAVQELERTGAFEREVLAIAGTTGSGWIDSNVAQALEYLHGGDTAIVAVQYSYLPSWVSFLVDEEKAGRATRALVEAVRERWQRQPAASRPKLVVTGESLGAYAVERAFDGIDDLLASTDGALLLGTPHFSPIARELREARDPGSPVWRPRYDGGRHVRWAQFPDKDLARPAGAPWATPRVVYLQNASDPIVWWSTDLLFSRPEWMRDPLGPDITPEINWFPVVAFWQTTVDMAVSYGVQAPHGHRYGAAAADGWAAVVPPDGWTAQDTRRLHAYLAGRKTPY